MAINNVNVEAAEEAIILGVEDRYFLDLLYGPTFRNVHDFKAVKTDKKKDGTPCTPHCKISFTIIENERDENGKIRFDADGRAIKTYIYANAIVWINRERDAVKFQKDIKPYLDANGLSLVAVSFNFLKDTSHVNKDQTKWIWSCDCENVVLVPPVKDLHEFMTQSSNNYGYAAPSTQAPVPTTTTEEDEEDENPF